MNDELFYYLTKGVSLGREHPSLFLYDGDVCHLVCHSTAARKSDYALVSIETEGEQIPYEDIPLMNADPSKLKMLEVRNISVNDSAEGRAVELLKGLSSDESRLEVLSRFCSHCGSTDPGCHCWNDE